MLCLLLLRLVANKVFGIGSVKHNKIGVPGPLKVWDAKEVYLRNKGDIRYAHTRKPEGICRRGVQRLQGRLVCVQSQGFALQVYENRSA